MKLKIALFLASSSTLLVFAANASAMSRWY